MKVFFTCSTKNIAKYAKTYRAIRNEIISLGNDINRDWIDYSINVAQRGIADIPTHTVYKDVMSAILTADAVVVDATVRGMSIGHQLTFALQKGKPVLLLKKKSKDKRHKKLFIEGSESQELHTAEYNNIRDIRRALVQFFKSQDDKSVKRFNLVLKGVQESYISWAAFNYRKSKTEIIQDAIDKIADKDITYKNYLKKQT